MPRCFVIQPFDNGVFDARYEDIFAPAIEAADLEAYRVDRDPSASVPIQNIESEIRASAICLADISVDNPNVWYELGFASASHKQIVMICSDERKTKFPFDVQHRSIIKYTAGSRRDFEKLEREITAKLVAYLEKGEAMLAATTATTLKQVEGLEQHEMMVLVAIGELIASESDGVSAYRVRNEMENFGHTKFAATLGLRTLREKRLLQIMQLYDEQSGETYDAYGFTDEGWTWLQANQRLFALKK